MKDKSPKCGHNNSHYDEKVPRTLSTVLLKEYEHLGIFSASEVEDFDVAKQKAEEAAGIECFICLRNEFENGLSLEEYKRRNKGRSKIREDLLKSIREKLHEKPENKKPTALCFSGGGIRSAIFNLGVLQGLAKHGLLNKFDYLSTVSGGGYIGSWLSAWIKRDAGGIDSIQEKLNPKNYTAHEVEPKEITHLRSYSNYMSPRLGIFSSDTLTLIAVFLRNLLLNWTVLLPIIAAVLLFPRIILATLNLSEDKSDYSLFLIFMAGFGIFGAAMILLARPNLKTWFRQNYKQDDIYYSSNADNKVFLWCFLPIIFSAFLSVIYWFNLRKSPDNLSPSYFVLFGIILFSGGFFLSAQYLFKHYGEYKKTSEKKLKSWKFIGKYISNFIEKRAFSFEMVFTVICGAVGGYLLYLGAKYFKDIALPIFTLFPETTDDVIFACLGLPVFLTVFLVAATLYVGLVSKFTDDMDREWVARFGGWVLVAIGGWLILSLTVLFGHRLFAFDESANNSVNLLKKIVASAGGISGLFTLVTSFSEKTPAGETEKKLSVKDRLIILAPQILAPAFILILFALISYITLGLLAKTEPNFGFGNPFVWFGIFVAIGAIMGIFININKFSLHAMYRERIIRAFLGASNSKFYENANSYTGLDSANDNIPMKDLVENKPLHVVNMTLNLSKPNNLAWQSRKAESFTVTPFYCGSSNMGGAGNYRPTAKYGGFQSQNKKPITLGTAAAISGAAANPNMGYYTFSSAVIFLMVLFNIRLGWWLGNTGLRGSETWQSSTPYWSPAIFLAEALGQTTDERGYVNLSDGGHFDNLGLYEMVLRRCHLIVVSDAGADSAFSFSDFATAIHKIRVDFGISIEFAKGSEPKTGRNCAIGTIRYKDVDGPSAINGTIIYFKPTLDGNESIDLINYKKKNADFPHETTADQFFGETQFESYRSLGFHQIDSIFKDKNGNISKCEDLPEMKKRADYYLKNTSEKLNEKANKRRLRKRLIG